MNLLMKSNLLLSTSDIQYIFDKFLKFKFINWCFKSEILGQLFHFLFLYFGPHLAVIRVYSWQWLRFRGSTQVACMQSKCPIYCTVLSFQPLFHLLKMQILEKNPKCIIIKNFKCTINLIMPNALFVKLSYWAVLFLALFSGVTPGSWGTLWDAKNWSSALLLLQHVKQTTLPAVLLLSLQSFSGRTDNKL